MPITTIDLNKGFLLQVCAACGLEHTIRFDRAAAETKVPPFSPSDGSTLELQVNDAPLVTLTLEKSDAANLGSMTASELKSKLAGVTGIEVSIAAAGTVVVESATTGPASRLEITGTAAAAFGLLYPAACPGRPTLGHAAGSHENKDVIRLRACGCGACEVVNRTWDAAPSALEGSHFFEHRRAVNSLGEHFKQQGWVSVDLASALKAENAKPHDRHADGTKMINVPLVS